VGGGGGGGGENSSVRDEGRGVYYGEKREDPHLGEAIETISQDVLADPDEGGGRCFDACRSKTKRGQKRDETPF